MLFVCIGPVATPRERGPLWFDAISDALLQLRLDRFEETWGLKVDVRDPALEVSVGNIISLERDYVEVSFLFQAQPFRHTDARRSLAGARSKHITVPNHDWEVGSKRRSSIITSQAR